MKQVFAFIGSPLKTKSNTATLTRMLLERLAEKDPEIRSDLLTAGDVRVNYCAGCWACMLKGGCPQDRKDDMGMLKEKLLAADLVIVGSPVYTMSVSGQMKTFLDRLCAWYHTIRLAGKPGVSVATTAAGGLEQVHDLQEMLMSALGVKVVARLDTRGYTPGRLADPEAAKRSAQAAADAVYPYLAGETQVESDATMEQAFQAMKAKSVGARQWLPGDYEHWKQSGMLACETYADLLAKLRRAKP